MLAATLSQIVHIQRQFAVTVDASALQPRLFEKTQQALVVLCPWALRLRLPRVIAAGVDFCILNMRRTLYSCSCCFDERVPSPGLPGKVRGGFF